MLLARPCWGHPLLVAGAAGIGWEGWHGPAVHVCGAGGQPQFATMCQLSAHTQAGPSCTLSPIPHHPALACCPLSNSMDASTSWLTARLATSSQTRRSSRRAASGQVRCRRGKRTFELAWQGCPWLDGWRGLQRSCMRSVQRGEMQGGCAAPKPLSPQPRLRSDGDRRCWHLYHEPCCLQRAEGEQGECHHQHQCNAALRRHVVPSAC